MPMISTFLIVFQNCGAEKWLRSRLVGWAFTALLSLKYNQFYDPIVCVCCVVLCVCVTCLLFLAGIGIR